MLCQELYFSYFVFLRTLQMHQSTKNLNKIHSVRFPIEPMCVCFSMQEVCKSALRTSSFDVDHKRLQSFLSRRALNCCTAG